MFFQANKLEHRYDPTCSGGITLPESKLKNWCCYSACFLPIRALPNTNSPLGVFNIIIFDAIAVNRLVRTIFKLDVQTFERSQPLKMSQHTPRVQ
jgi:hypothetical protein